MKTLEKIEARLRKLKFAVGIPFAMLCIGLVTGAAYYGNNLVISPTLLDSTSTTNAVVNFPAWPIVVASSTAVTNFTAVNIDPYKDLCLSFSCAGTNATTTSNVVWTLYRGGHGGAPTNALGTSLDYDVLGYVTNFLNGTTRVTTVATYTAVARTTAVTGQSTDGGIAGLNTIYIGSVNCAVANSGITNYQVYNSGN